MLGHHRSLFQKLRGGKSGHAYLLPNLISFIVITGHIQQRRCTGVRHGCMERSLCPRSELLQEPNPSYHLHHARCATRRRKQANTAGVGCHIHAATPFQLKVELSKFLSAWKKEQGTSHRLWQHADASSNDRVKTFLWSCNSYGQS